jgi:hypothetical protein
VNEPAIKALKALEKLSDDDLSHLMFIMPWQYGTGSPDGVVKDEDGFTVYGGPTDKTAVLQKRSEIQTICWAKFHSNPQISTAVRNTVGRLTGLGFGTFSDIPEIEEAINLIELDQRNRLYSFWPKFVGRTIIEGELYLCLTVHKDGFIEVDYFDPDSFNDSVGDNGIIYHPNKALMPLVYTIKGSNGGSDYAIPSIYLGYYPDLLKEARKNTNYVDSTLDFSRSSLNKFNKLGGFFRFMIAWDRGFMTRRNVGYLRTTLEWLNYYENLKKYEIDHKKSAGSYLWVVTMQDVKAFKAWLALSDEDKRKTGIGAKKTPGSTLVLPPGMDAKAIAPNLPRISGEDTDIMEMVISGLNEPEDITLGRSRSPYASVKASRGPMSDRISDEIAYFERFLKYDFWKPIFFLRAQVGAMASTYPVREAMSFDRSQNPVIKKVKKSPEELIEISFPTSEMIDIESRARGLLGVKHGSVIDTLGIPAAEVAKRLGMQNYRKLRLMRATEEDKFPELIPAMDAETAQEQQIEPPKSKPTAKPAPKKNQTKKGGE